MIKKHKSTVLSLAWHPCSQVLATGSSDFKARVFSAHVSVVDAAQDAGGFETPVGFGEPYAEFACSGWVHAVAYSPSGSTLAFAGHDASIHFARFDGGGAPTVQTIRFPFLPLCQLLFTDEATLVGAGHDANPAVFSAGGGGRGGNQTARCLQDAFSLCAARSARAPERASEILANFEVHPTGGRHRRRLRLGVQRFPRQKVRRQGRGPRR